MKNLGLYVLTIQPADVDGRARATFRPELEIVALIVLRALILITDCRVNI